MSTNSSTIDSNSNPAISKVPVVQITNKTAHRLALTRVGSTDLVLLIPPFGIRLIPQDLLQNLDYQRWEQHCLITVEPLLTQARARNKAVSPISKPRRKGAAPFQNIVSISLILLIAVGLPLLIVLISLRGLQLLDLPGEVVLDSLFGRGVQLVFITITSAMPGLLYFLFARQQLESIRTNFLREVLLLDPNIMTLDEAELKYSELINDNYASFENGPARLTSSLPVLLCTIFITLGWLLTMQPLGVIKTLNFQTLISAQNSNFNYGFLGSYFFALNMLFRRYLRADLSSKAYSHVVVRILVTTILIWTVAVLPLSEDWKNLFYPLGFVIGILPETGVALIQQSLRKLVGRFIDALNEAHPVTDLEGVSLYDQARLLEEGIENIENLAHHNIVELRLRTRIPMPRLVDMFDQAILYLHLDNGQDGPSNDLTILRHYGIRTATDLEEAYRATDPANQPIFLNLLNGSDQEKLARLAIIMKTLADDDWMAYLRNWRKFSRTTQTIYDPQSLYNDSFVVCPACHVANGSQNRFCSSCGAALQNKPVADGQPLTLKPLPATLPSDVGKEQKPTEAAAPLTTSN